MRTVPMTSPAGSGRSQCPGGQVADGFVATQAVQAAAAIVAFNQALEAELRLIAAYGFGEESQLLHSAALELAQVYRAHHEQHAELLSQTVKRLGGTPAAPAKDYGFAAADFNNDEDVLALAARLEQRAVGACLRALPDCCGNRELANAATRILGDDAMHCAVLRQALGGSPVFMT
jgi:hypothetical protein